MFATIALLCLLFALLAVLRRRPPPSPHGPVSPPPQPPTLPLPTRHVSFSLVSSDTSCSLPPVQRRWSSPFHKRKSSAPDSPRAPQPYTTVDQFGRILPSSPPASDVHSSPKPARRLSTPLRLSFTSKRRSSSVSCTSTLIRLDQVDARAPSPPSSTSATRPSTPPQRTRFINPFSKHSRSRTLSPPSTFKAPNTPPLNPSSTSSPSSPPARRRVLVGKFKSIFRSISPQPSPIVRSKPFLTTINTRLRRKPVARTEPYGPPWNASMPLPDFAHSRHSLRKPAQMMSPSPQSSRKHSVHEYSRSEKTPLSPGQLSPRTFINELDEKLSILQQQRIRDSIPSPTDKKDRSCFVI